MIALVAFCDGLVSRDIRKYTGGHESSYVFHKAKRWIVPSLMLTISVYLMLPFSLPPVVIFAPAMGLTGMMIYIAASRFKKFL
jgi:integrating conjugative element membrane protein (TIGR03747 family)